MNRIACSVMVFLSGTCFLKGEIAPPETVWKGKNLDYEGVSIINKIPLPQKGVKFHSEEGLSYDIMPAQIKMMTCLSKIPQHRKEWYYKGIDYIVLKYCGDIAQPDDGGTIYFQPVYLHHVSFDPKMYGEWGIMYTRVYVIASYKTTELYRKGDYGISGEDGSIFFQYVEKMLVEL